MATPFRVPAQMAAEVKCPPSVQDTVSGGELLAWYLHLLPLPNASFFLAAHPHICVRHAHQGMDGIARDGHLWDTPFCMGRTVPGLRYQPGDRFDARDGGGIGSAYSGSADASRGM